MTDDELTAAYLDGVAELTPDERKRVELRLADPAARAEADAMRGVIEDVRAMSQTARTGSSDPDWQKLEQSIRSAVGPTVPVPWWRKARWLAPISALATTAAIALVWLHHVPQAEPAGAFAVVMPHPIEIREPAAPPIPVRPAPAASTTMYIDGVVIDIGDVDPETLFDAGTPGANDVTADEADTGLLPAQDLGWIDELDEQAMQRAEHWLAHKKGG